MSKNQRYITGLALTIPDGWRGECEPKQYNVLRRPNGSSRRRFSIVSMNRTG